MSFAIVHVEFYPYDITYIETSVHSDQINFAKLVCDETAAGIVSRFVKGNNVDDNRLAEQIARECINDLRDYIDQHLARYHKYTLNVQIDPSDLSVSSQVNTFDKKFFNLISLLKDVSILGRKLLDATPQFNTAPRPASSLATESASRPKSPSNASHSTELSIDAISTTLNFDKLSLRQSKAQKTDDSADATSEDLLAALIESSSASDDFLVLSSSLDSMDTLDLLLAAFILIKAHDCFTLSHDIHGVAIVLKRVKFLIMHILAPKNQMDLITKLLTSIGRYNEMNYVFDLFRDRNQFECLLGKGVKRTPELGIALFNYVKRNPEYLPLVTLNFSMFREMAESLKASAIKRLDRLIAIRKSFAATEQQRAGPSARSKSVMHHRHPLDQILSDSEDSPADATAMPHKASSMLSRSSSASSLSPTAVNIQSLTSANLSNQASVPAKLHTVASSSATTTTPKPPVIAAPPIFPEDGLNLILVELVDANDCFSKAGCYKRATRCERLAKLVALQMALSAHCGAPIDVLSLSRTQIEPLNELIASLGSFQDAYIVADAYEHHLAWRQALFRNVILRQQPCVEPIVTHTSQGDACKQQATGHSDTRWSRAVRYLNEFCRRLELTDALVGELVILYKQYINNRHHTDNEELSKAMEMVVTKLTNIELKCKLFTQLNFTQAKVQLLKDPATEAHLKDLKLA